MADTQGFRPLHFAAQQNAAEAAELLLQAAVNMHGNTPLWAAVFNSRGEAKLIKLLRRYGADPNRVNAHGTTPVELARRIANYPVAVFFEDLD